MTKKKIYIADDDPAILEIISMILEDRGFEVETSNNGKSIEQKTEEYPDLVMLDIRMSGISGGDICKHLKTNPRTKSIPVVLISANRDIEKIAQESGANGYLPKPFDVDDLLDVANRFIVKN